MTLPGTSGDRSDGALPLVRALAGRAGLRTVGGRPSTDSGQARPEAEERPTRCGTHSQATDGRSLSQDLDAESRESRRTATAVAPPSVSRDANTSHDQVPGYCHERRAAGKEGTGRYERA